MTTPLRPGIAGLGIIGQRAAASLRAKGWSPSVWNRTAKPNEPGWTPTPADLAKACDVIQFFVADGRALLATLKPMLPHLGPGKVIINCATISLTETRQAAKIVTTTGATFLDCPFTGSREAAAAGQLTYYVGGDPCLLEKVRPILEASSKDILHTGGTGTATVLKIATNMVTATTVGILAEAMAVVAASDIPLTKFQAALSRNASDSAVARMKIPSIIAADYTPHFSLKHMLKDATLGLGLAYDAGLQLPILTSVAERMAALEANGRGDEDFSVLATNYLPQRK